MRLSIADLVYLEQFHKNIHEKRAELAQWLTTECPECSGNDPDIHLTFNLDNPTGSNTKPGEDIILIGCEGYHILPPEPLGIFGSGWDDWTHYMR